MKATGVLLLLAGLVLGPGYYVYTRFYTGREITVKPLVFQSEKDGSSQASATTDLLPVMGPITFILNFTASHGPALDPAVAAKNVYHSRVSFDGKTLMERRFVLTATHLEATPAQVFKEALPTLTIHTPGRYTLELIQEKDAGMQINEASMQVRVGVEHLNNSLLAGGIVMLVLGLILLIAF